jgi:hypothetical protein
MEDRWKVNRWAGKTNAIDDLLPGPVISDGDEEMLNAVTAQNVRNPRIRSEKRPKTFAFAGSRPRVHKTGNPELSAGTNGVRGHATVP